MSTGYQPHYRDIPAMGHHFDHDLRCSQVGCYTTWEQHQEHPRSCRGEKRIQRQPSPQATGLALTCQRYGVYQIDIAERSGLGKNCVYRYFTGQLKDLDKKCLIELSIIALFQERGVELAEVA